MFRMRLPIELPVVKTDVFIVSIVSIVYILSMFIIIVAGSTTAGQQSVGYLQCDSLLIHHQLLHA